MQLTIRKYIEAIEQNGLPQLFGQMYDFDEKQNKIVAACAMGQAKINLGLTSLQLTRFENHFHKTGSYAYQVIKGTTVPMAPCPVCQTVRMNDGEQLSFEAIGSKLREQFADQLDTPVSF